MTATATVNTQELVGEIIGGDRYDLRELLGGGSMGYVYRAYDRRLETDVVVKIPRRHKLENPDSLRRFRQESKFLVKLNHPHVVSILDVGEYAGVPFFVMPYISGGCLRSRQKNELGVQRPLKPASLRSWLLEIAKALDFIHAQSCIHRDVKPDNILFDEDGNAFITDFGIATARFHGRLTATGRAMGTPHYMSPEQAMGKLVDGRSDIYALGVVMYEALVGFPPFDGADAFSVGYKHVHETPVALGEVDSRVPQALADVVMQCLEKAPEDRYPRGIALADALLAYLARSENGSASHRSAAIARKHASPPHV